MRFAPADKASARKLGRLINLVIAFDQFIRGRRYLEAAFEAFLPRRCPLLALSGHRLVRCTCPLLTKADMACCGASVCF